MPRNATQCHATPSHPMQCNQSSKVLACSRDRLATARAPPTLLRLWWPFSQWDSNMRGNVWCWPGIREKTMWNGPKCWIHRVGPARRAGNKSCTRNTCTPNLFRGIQWLDAAFTLNRAGSIENGTRHMSNNVGQYFVAVNSPFASLTAARCGRNERCDKSVDPMTSPVRRSDRKSAARPVH
jgi:hypothetical protein